MEETAINIMTETGEKKSVLLQYDQSSTGESKIIINVDDQNKFIGVSSNWFLALREIRKQTDKMGIKLLVQASRPNCWPSGMSAQMSNGFKIYVHDLSRNTQNWKLVNSFDEASESEIGTIGDQDNFREQLTKIFLNAH